MGKIDQMDSILKNSLRPEYEPAWELNERILQRAREEKMSRKSQNIKNAKTQLRVLSKNKKKARPFAAAAAIFGICILGSATAYAAIRYLTPSQVATQALDDPYLAAAFAEKQAVRLGEQKKADGYIFTLLGVTSGKGLNHCLDTDSASLDQSESYAVLAIEKEDGTAMPDISDAGYELDRFLVSPLIGGQDPMRVNVYSLDGSAAEIVHEGIAYRIVSCKELDMFADRGVYLAVCRGLDDLRDGYVMDDRNGKLSCREDFDGLNVLFELPLDAEKADHEAAEAVLTELASANDTVAASEDGESGGSEAFAAPQDLKEWLRELEAGMSGDETEKRCHIVAGSEQMVSPDETGAYTLEDDNGLREYMTKEFVDQSGSWQITGYDYADTLDSLQISMYQYHADGTVTFALFTPDIP